MPRKIVALFWVLVFKMWKHISEEDKHVWAWAVSLRRSVVCSPSSWVFVFAKSLPDFTEALKLEPDNKTAKEELGKVAKFIEVEKRKVCPWISFILHTSLKIFT